MSIQTLLSFYQQEHQDTPRVLLQTDEWEYSAYKKNDPIFSVLIPDLPLDEIPDEMELSSCVAEILETEWSALLSLGQAMTYRENMENNWRNRVYHYAGITLRTRGETYTRDAIDTGYPRLSSLLRLSKLITFPPRWELYVTLDRDVPQQERLHHMQAVANILEEGLPEDLEKDYEEAPRVGDLYLCAPCDILRFIFSTTVKDRHLASLVIAQFRNLYLTRICRIKNIELHHVLWEDLSVILPDGEAKDVVELILGRGDIAKVDVKFEHYATDSDRELCTCFMQNMNEKHPIQVHFMLAFLWGYSEKERDRVEADQLAVGGTVIPSYTHKAPEGFLLSWGVALKPLDFVGAVVASTWRDTLGVCPMRVSCKGEKWDRRVTKLFTENRALGLQLCRLLLPHVESYTLGPILQHRVHILSEWYKQEASQQ